MNTYIETVDKSEYPMIETPSLELMKAEAYTEEAKRVVFPHVIENASSWYVDIYLYSKPDDRFERMIICPGKVMSNHDVNTLLNIFGDTVMAISKRYFEFFMEDINRVAPYLHVARYRFDIESLIHTYYASHASGLKELLYKSGLGDIANDLFMIKGLDRNASNLEKAFKMPFKLIRKCNNTFGIWEILKAPETRHNAVCVYNRFHSILNDIDTLDYYQWKYLNECYEDGSTPDKYMLRQFGQMEVFYEDDNENSDALYKCYKDYLNNIKIIEKRVGKLFPKHLDFSDPSIALSACQTASMYAHRGEELESELDYIYESLMDRYAYVDDDYIIVPPSSVALMIKEAFNLKNCLCQYIIPFLRGRTDILFMRKRCEEDRSYIVLEIRDNKVMQAKKACNKDIDKIDAASLRKFCKHTGIDIPPVCWGWPH